MLHYQENKLLQSTQLIHPVFPLLMSMAVAPKQCTINHPMFPCPGRLALKFLV